MVPLYPDTIAARLYLSVVSSSFMSDALTVAAAEMRTNL